MIGLSDRAYIEAHDDYYKTADMNVEDVARHLGVSSVTVYTRWKRLGLRPKPRSNQPEPNGEVVIKDKRDEAYVAAWRRYSAGGVTQRELADEFGNSVQSLLYHWRRLGVYEERMTSVRRDQEYREAGRRFVDGEDLDSLADEMEVLPKTLYDRFVELGYTVGKAEQTLAVRRDQVRYDVHPASIRQAWCAVWAGPNIEHLEFARTTEEAEQRARAWVRRTKGT